MQKLQLRITQFLSICLFIGMVACEENETATPEVAAIISVGSKGSFDNVLSDPEGNSLYYFANDVDGTATCADGCLDAWPVFYMKDIKVASGLNAAGFANITRADGIKQTTYKGWPLYTFASDAAPADTKGDGVGGVWYIAKTDYTLMLGNKAVDGSDVKEKYLVDAVGNSLYVFANDEENVSNCEGGCVSAWPVFEGESTLVLPSAPAAAKFSSIARADGKNQITYAGKPLYYFAQDAERGDVKGHTVPNWLLSIVPL